LADQYINKLLATQGQFPINT